MIESGVTRHERALQEPTTGAAFHPAREGPRRRCFRVALSSRAASLRSGHNHPKGHGETRGLNLRSTGFTLLEVMIAVAFIGIAMLALLSLHRSDLLSIARARDMTRAAMLAQSMMADAEMVRFPMPGQLSGDFQKMYPGQYPNFRWQRKVEQSHEFPDIYRVRITIFYGPRFRRTFVLTEFMHSPVPQLSPSSSPADGQDPNGSPSGQSGNITP